MVGPKFGLEYHWKCMVENQNWAEKISETVDSRNQLYENILQIWTNISVDYIRNVHSSIPKTYAQRTARGCITKYQRAFISCLNRMKRAWR
jgi:hypothetical protein